MYKYLNIDGYIILCSSPELFTKQTNTNFNTNLNLDCNWQSLKDFFSASTELVLISVSLPLINLSILVQLLWNYFQFYETFRVLQFLNIFLKINIFLADYLNKNRIVDKILPHTNSYWNFFLIKNTFSGQPIETQPHSIQLSAMYLNWTVLISDLCFVCVPWTGSRVKEKMQGKKRKCHG